MKPMHRENLEDDFVLGYMCMIDFECELGAAMDGNKVYPSIEDLKADHDCWEACGIVEVRVQYVRTVVEQNLNKELEDE